ncbi:MAG TPA: YwbE family protein [Bacteroidales bacterium]|nr:YwbE family protein [Bacteroidales bacterium]HPR72514.1 YwbE family protein [Bacteroidales bacterium]
MGTFKNINYVDTMDGTRRADVRPGIGVMVELTEHKRTGKLTGGKVKEVLTTAPTHPHGIKVMLESGLIGRIKRII